MNQDFDAVIQALTKFRNNAAENDEKLQRVMVERDTLLSELATANGRVLELETQLSASVRVSEAMRQAMEIAQEESRRWHDQCNSLVRALHAYSATPHRLLHDPAPPTRYSGQDRPKRVERTSTSQTATKVKDETDNVLVSEHEHHSSFGDVNDPRHIEFARGQSSRSKRVLQIYSARSTGSPQHDEEESDDELNGITPAKHVRDVPRQGAAHAGRTDKQRIQSLGRKRKSPPMTSNVRKVKR